MTTDEHAGRDADQCTPLHDSYPGEAASCAEIVAASLASIARLAQLPANLTDAELTDTARALALVAQQAEASLVAVTADAISRGAVYRSTAASAKQWVQRLSTGEACAALLPDEHASAAGPLVPLDDPSAEARRDAGGEVPIEGSEVTEAADDDIWRSGFEPAHAARIAKLAEAVRAPANRRLADAVVSGRVNITIGKTCLDNIDKLKAVLPTAGRDEILEWLLTIGVGAGAKAVTELKKRILAQFGDDILDENEDALQGVESVDWFDTPEGMVRFIAELSPDHAEVIINALQSLSAPSPGSDCCDDPHHRHTSNPAPGSAGVDSTSAGRDGATNSCDGGDQPKAQGSSTTKTHRSSRKGEPDPRSAAKRRADALMLLLGLGAAAVDNDAEIKHRGSARLIVTIDYEALAGILAGLGTTPTGTGISPDTVRQLACDAEILPMVLGSKNQPLNVGRKKRLVEDELRDAVIHRDKHCTYAGCDRPPVMCDVHHVKSWWLGGLMSLLNSALLCSTHHRIVHRDNLTATVTNNKVIWHYTSTGTKVA